MNTTPEVLKLYPGLRPICDTEDSLMHAPELTTKTPYLRLLRTLSTTSSSDSGDRIEVRIDTVNQLHQEVQWAATVDREDGFVPPLPARVSDLLQSTDKAIEALGEVDYQGSNSLMLAAMNDSSRRLLSVVAMCGYRAEDNPSI